MKPNPSLHAIDQAPFYAVKIVPGDLGTKGGLVTDERARVLRPDGSVIPGLYAAGNTSAAVMGRTYAGPGATIGPAMTFGYLAAESRPGSTDRARRPTMPIDPDKADRRRTARTGRSRGRSPTCCSTTSASASAPDPGDNLDAAPLRYTLDDDNLQVLPSFGIVAPTFHETDPPPLDLPGCDIDLAQVVHGSQEIAVARPAARPSGRGDAAHPDHRRVGQGQGGRHLAGGRRPLDETASRCGPRARRSSCAARAAGAATAAPRRRSSSPTARPTATRRTT